MPGRVESLNASVGAGIMLTSNDQSYNEQRVKYLVNIRAMLAQRTLSNSIQSIWNWLAHSGEPITLKLLPAPPDARIIFRRVDLDPVVEIQKQELRTLAIQPCRLR